jgi:hypothetical protein
MSDYRQRLRDEYRQLGERTARLGRMLHKWEMGELDFEPTCSRELLTTQLHVMMAYRSILEERAHIEDVPLTEDDHE